MPLLPVIALGITAFVATNLDDSLILLLFFGDRRFRARHVFAGQALGISLLVLLSLIGVVLALTIPERWLGLLGLLPIALGIRQLVEWRVDREKDEKPLVVPYVHNRSGWRRAATVAGVTLANGGDNIGVYMPLFATRSLAQTVLLLAVFTVMLGVWTFGAFYLARQSVAARPLQAIGRRLLPYALIAIGLVILADAFLIR
jgi:cadmium resistance protein CadD (predicted permease)